MLDEDLLKEVRSVQNNTPMPAEPVTPPEPTPTPQAQAPAAPVQEPTPNPTPTPTPQATTPAEPTPPAAEPPAPTPDDSIYKKLEEITSGAITDENSLRSTLERTTQLEQELNTLKSQNPFANDFSKSVNDLIAKGAKPEEIAEFARIQSLNVEEMDDRQVLITAMKMEKPYLSAEEINANVDQIYDGFKNEDGEIDYGVSAKIKERVHEAKGFLVSSKVNASSPQSVQQNQEAEQAKQSLIQGWTQKGINVFDNLKLDGLLEMGENQILAKFDIPATIKQQVIQATAQTLGYQGISLDNEKDAQDTMRSLVYALHGPELIKQAMKTAYQNGIETTTRNNAGLNVPRPGAQVPGQEQKPDWQTEAREIQGIN